MPSWQREYQRSEPIRITDDKTSYELKLGDGPTIGG